MSDPRGHRASRTTNRMPVLQRQGLRNAGEGHHGDDVLAVSPMRRDLDDCQPDAGLTAPAVSRQACRRSSDSWPLESKHAHRVGARGPARDRKNSATPTSISTRDATTRLNEIEGTARNDEAAQGSRRPQRQHASDHKGRSHHPGPLSERRRKEARWICTKRDTKGQFQTSRGDVMSDDTEQSDAAERQRQQSEAHERERQHTPCGHAGRIGDDIPHRSGAHWQIAVEPRDGVAHGRDHVRVRSCAADDNKARTRGGLPCGQ